MIIYLSAAVLIVGLILMLIYYKCVPSTKTTETAAEIGRIMFLAGLLAFLLLYQTATPIRLIH